MTEKRFTMGKDKGHWYIRDTLEDVYHRDMTLPNDIANVCYVLNEQHEEIQSLKLELELSKPLFSRRQLEEENEQLKQQLEDCKTYNATLYANNIKSDRMLVNDIKELRKGNEELKQQINTMINELQTEKETAISRNERIRLDFAITVLEELKGDDVND